MSIQEAKQIRIADYLHSLGYEPLKQQGISLWYLSPLRSERTPSFKVNTAQNLWFDFGLGKGGNIIDFAALYYHSNDMSYLLAQIEKQTPGIRPTSFSFGQCTSSVSPTFEHITVGELQSDALLSYLRERGINTAIAQKECKELHYTHNGKRYFTIAFANLAGGYEIRNRYFKGCISPKDITHRLPHNTPQETCYVFEGFMDYLSFLTIRLQSCPTLPSLECQDYLILNSTANVQKAIDRLVGYERIHCFLDNDAAGKDTVLALQAAYPYKVRDSSQTYAPFKDLNEYLQHRQKQDYRQDSSQTSRSSLIPARQESSDDGRSPKLRKSSGRRM